MLRRKQLLCSDVAVGRMKKAMHFFVCLGFFCFKNAVLQSDLMPCLWPVVELAFVSVPREAIMTKHPCEIEQKNSGLRRIIYS